MASVTFAHVDKRYPDGTHAVRDLSLEVVDGEFLVLVGPSGCGKTTALRMVAGLEEITGGELLIGDRVVNDLEPRQRDVAMVFQNYALYPHMTVFDNIGFPLASQGVDRKTLRERVERTATLLDLDEHLKRRPRNLSGGQRQRVAMGRALIREPQVFLMDEPLSNLDAKLRVEMRGEIAALQQRLGITTIYVTHDQVEAMTMGTRIAVMRKGVLQQEGEPYTLYDTPVNLFVAEFIGSPPMNLFCARLDVVDGEPLLALLDQQLRLPTDFLETRPVLAGHTGRDLAVGVRPEHLHDAAAFDDGAPRLQAEVRMVELLGAERHVHLRLGARPVFTDQVREVIEDVDAGAAASLAAQADAETVRVIARFDVDSEVHVGETRHLSLPPEKLRFFDLESGTAIR